MSRKGCEITRPPNENRTGSVHVLPEFAAVESVQSFGFVSQDIDEAVSEIRHQPRQWHRCRSGDPAGMRRWLDARPERTCRPLPYDAWIIRQISHIMAHDRINFPLRGDPAYPFSAAVEKIRKC